MHPPPLNTPAPPISTLYSAGDHQSYQLRAPAKMLHQGLSPPPRSVASSSSSSNYTAGSHLPPLAAAAATTHPPPSPARGLSYILNPTEKENQIENPDSNVHVQQNSRNYLRVCRFISSLLLRLLALPFVFRIAASVLDEGMNHFSVILTRTRVNSSFPQGRASLIHNPWHQHALLTKRMWQVLATLSSSKAFR